MYACNANEITEIYRNTGPVDWEHLTQQTAKPSSHKPKEKNTLVFRTKYHESYVNTAYQQSPWELNGRSTSKETSTFYKAWRLNTVLTSTYFNIIIILGFPSNFVVIFIRFMPTCSTCSSISFDHPNIRQRAESTNLFTVQLKSSSFLLRSYTVYRTWRAFRKTHIFSPHQNSIALLNLSFYQMPNTW